MSHSQSPWPFERPEQLADLLREQGASPDECADLLPVLHRLPEWQAPQPEPADTRRLLARLTTELPTLSPVRQAIRAHQQRRHANFSLLLATARAQVSLFGLGFWLVSALVTLVGSVVVLSKILSDQEMVLRASGPLLAYLGTLVAFRGRGARVLELELVCPPSPLQLVMARLVIVLGYDVGLGLALGLVLWAGGAEHVLALTLSWLMPLLLVVGLALLLSLRLPVQAAASLAYGSWLAILAIGSITNLQALLLTPELSVLPGCIGIALLAIALLRLHADMHRLLPRP
ncbi:hypothetical protein KSC_091240 [Ktedonobacter sp. SOSP1-52]|uniref:hypothetical protein n=1 Tax=Ktedonobacter sp. SOSP1-52 TaxID=2778366 RepID=UPI001916C0EF|nr:hypothetical protein [Ktedonobacter sp. SOSP1-52]GHO70232.1 hypothetical protein KSC_091240 [Ktedonobacter sp. SOSP1-52]